MLSRRLASEETRFVLLAQGGYYVATGVVPFVSRSTLIGSALRGEPPREVLASRSRLWAAVPGGAGRVSSE
jgi:hypothetical protein